MPTDFSPQTRQGVIQVRDRAGIGLPFSKGLMATSILATGVETDVAFRLAADIEHELCDHQQNEVAADQLVDLELEAAYELGPASPHLQRWSRQVPLWLLSNHRSPWLLPRLERFELTKFFQRVIISDVIGAAKPEPAAYAEILERTTSPASALFVDDQNRNVAAAAKIGLTAFHAGADLSWIAAVDDALYRNAIPH
jgi:HAD superfamily hydrolase (TIGR01549 family)